MGGRGSTGRAHAVTAGSTPIHAVQPSTQQQVPADPPPAPKSRPVSGPQLESSIRDIYHELSTQPQDWIRLARIHALLPGADKAEVDQALLKMMKTGTVHLVPDSNRKVLTDADHAAAIRIGGEDKNLIAIEPPEDDEVWR